MKKSLRNVPREDLIAEIERLRAQQGHTEELESVLHELRVHQEEISVQNAQLTLSHTAHTTAVGSSHSLTVTMIRDDDPNAGAIRDVYPNAGENSGDGEGVGESESCC